MISQLKFLKRNIVQIIENNRDIYYKLDLDITIENFVKEQVSRVLKFSHDKLIFLINLSKYIKNVQFYIDNNNNINLI